MYDQPNGRPRINQSSRQKNGLVLWYPLCSAESAAVAQLDCGNRGCNVTTTWTAGQNSLAFMPGYGWGMAMGATGAGRLIVDHGVLDSLAGGPITIAFWYRRTGTITAPGSLLGFGASASGGFALHPAVANNNNLAYFPGTGGLGTLSSNNWVDLGVRALDTTEHHCITGEGATLKHYVNGVSQSITFTGTGTQAQPTAYTGSRYFGSSNTGANPGHNLTLADLRIYNRALNAQEVWGLYAPLTRFELFENIDADTNIAGGALMMAEEDAGGGTSSGSGNYGAIRPIIGNIIRPIPRAILGA